MSTGKFILFLSDNGYYGSASTTVNDILLPYFFNGLARASRVSKFIAATNRFFVNKTVISCHLLRSFICFRRKWQMQLLALTSCRYNKDCRYWQFIIFPENRDHSRAKRGVDKCLIDTSPFFCTHFMWHAVDALIVPVKTDKQSINSLSLLLKNLENPGSEFRRTIPSDNHAPKFNWLF